MKSKELSLSRLYLNRNLNVNSNNDDLANSNDNGRIAYCVSWSGFMVKTHKCLFERVYSLENMIRAWEKARRNKTLHKNIIEFEQDLHHNLRLLSREIRNKTYSPRPLQTFILRDPKTRKISKSNFRDRVVHHAIVNVIGSLFEKRFIYDSCANQKKKGTTFALKRFAFFTRKVTESYKKSAFCLKADIKHYFEEVNHKILLSLIRRKIADEDMMWLIEKIVYHTPAKHTIGGGATEAKVCLLVI
jgi:RNA-directed DNA polymerase